MRKLGKDITGGPQFISKSLFIGNPVVIDGLLVTDYLASQDLNECVDALVEDHSSDLKKINPAYHYLGKKKLNPRKPKKIVDPTREIEKRTRMTKEHDNLFQVEFEKTGP